MNSTLLPIPPRPLRLLGGLLCVGVVGSAVVTAYAAWALPEKPLWAVVGLQVVGALAGIFGLFWSRGCFREGPGLALLCSAGSLMVSTALTAFAHRGTLGHISMKWWALAHLCAVGLLGAIGVCTMLVRNPESYKPARRSLVCAVPVALLLALVIAERRGLAPVFLTGLTRTLAFGGLFLLCGIALPACVQFAMNALGLCRELPSNGSER